MWHIYILKCSDKTLYTGITTDIQRRLQEHNSPDKGAKYTRGRRPVKLVYSKRKRNKASAAKEEHRIKQLTRIDKIRLIKVKKNGDRQ